MKLVPRSWEGLFIRSVYDIASQLLAGRELSGTGTGATYTIALTPRQYLSHMERNLGCPPKSQLKHRLNLRQVCYEQGSVPYHFNVTWPRWTLFILNPTVGIELQRRHDVRGSNLEQQGYTKMYSLDGEFATLRSSNQQ